MAVELEERRLDLAERNISTRSAVDDPRRRDTAGMFTIRNSHRARRRGWITTSTRVAELSISTGGNTPRENPVFDGGPTTTTNVTARRPRAERSAAASTVVSIGWSHPAAARSLNNEAGPKPSNKAKYTIFAAMDLK